MHWADVIVARNKCGEHLLNSLTGAFDMISNLSNLESQVQAGLDPLGDKMTEMIDEFNESIVNAVNDVDRTSSDDPISWLSELL